MGNQRYYVGGPVMKSRCYREACVFFDFVRCTEQEREEKRLNGEDVSLGSDEYEEDTDEEGSEEEDAVKGSEDEGSGEGNLLCAAMSGLFFSTRFCSYWVAFFALGRYVKD